MPVVFGLLKMLFWVPKKGPCISQAAYPKVLVVGRNFVCVEGNRPTFQRTVFKKITVLVSLQDYS